jgi:hypothetical protein
MPRPLSPIRAGGVLRALAAAGMLSHTGAASAIAQQPLSLPRLTGPIQLDGLSDEAAWRAVEPLPATMFEPAFGGPPTERTVFRLAYDDAYLYASGEFYDSDPAGVRATSLRRDDVGFSSDVFCLVVDSFNDKENSLLFWTTPAGIRSDVAVAQDGQRSVEVDWNTIWDAAARRTDEGWFAEIRVPLSSLRFQERDGRVVMGVGLWRRIARKNELDVFPAKPSTGPRSLFKASRTAEAALENIHRRNPVYAVPYLLLGAGRSHALDPGRTSYQGREQTARELGLDVKYAVTSNLTLDLTYNTDFAQVEADDQQVNLTRFSLFYP